MNIWQRWRAVLTETPPPHADKSATARGGRAYQYATLEQLLFALRPAMETHEICLVQGIDDGGMLATEIVGPEGERVTLSRVLIWGGDDPQAQGVALTYSRRYGLLCACAWAPPREEDNDAADYPQARTEQAAPPRQAPQRTEPIIQIGAKNGAAKGLTPTQALAKGGDAAGIVEWIAGDRYDLGPVDGPWYEKNATLQRACREALARARCAPPKRPSQMDEPPEAAYDNDEAAYR